MNSKYTITKRSDDFTASKPLTGEHSLERAEPQRGHREQGHGIYFRVVNPLRRWQGQPRQPAA